MQKSESCGVLEDGHFAPKKDSMHREPFLNANTAAGKGANVVRNADTPVRGFVVVAKAFAPLAGFFPRGD
jgi:hypothetical protein